MHRPVPENYTSQAAFISDAAEYVMYKADIISMQTYGSWRTHLPTVAAEFPDFYDEILRECR